MINLLLALMPSPIHVFLRRAMGQSIGKSSRIRLGTIIRTKKLSMGENTVIGPMVYLSADEIRIGSMSSIRGPTFMSCTAIDLGNNVRISSLVIVRSDKRKNAKLCVGHCSSIFPMCWLEPGEGITIGEQVSIGGFSLIFTHAVWTSYLEGGPMLRAPVDIGSGTYIPWKVFVLPGVTIGKDCVIGAGAIVNKSIPDNTMAAGVPAKSLRTPSYDATDTSEKRRRLEKILAEFAATNGGSFSDGKVRLGNEVYQLDPDLKIISDSVVIDLNNYSISTPHLGSASKLTNYFRDYGIRLNPKPMDR